MKKLRWMALAAIVLARCGINPTPKYTQPALSGMVAIEANTAGYIETARIPESWDHYAMFSADGASSWSNSPQGLFVSPKAYGVMLATRVAWVGPTRSVSIDHGVYILSRAEPSGAASHPIWYTITIATPDTLAGRHLADRILASWRYHDTP